MTDGHPACRTPALARHRPREDPAGPPAGTARALRGGSYLCHASYRRRYRVSARMPDTQESATVRPTGADG
ncbi:hypothetical protein [Streptomyces sp. NPDC051576]|uniref:hypothetical protein n=1 Tax=Streptomyces sp. NPDC051576 TaxID=3155803 RepID=UPI00341DEF80